ncbi:hypothetical protein L1O03_06945 [Corynebacterium uropygiale]|uniref:EcsC family protein n=1 Tax=Corynebacterium uropygiale TaxID=1775911 RepID=A0A9X1QSU1_9CORY|nr:hypothetical protein [Corynebacterium uropygiale]
MGLIDTLKNTLVKRSAQTPDSVTDGVGSDPAALEKNAGKAGKVLISVLDRAAAMQSGAITRYVDFLRSRHPEASPAEIQQMIDTHFLRIVSGSGGTVGAASALPGVGFIAGAAAISAESLLFLDAAAFYTMASAKIRGVDISDSERRRGLILLALLGSQGTAIVDTMIGDTAGFAGLPSAASLARLSTSRLQTVNNRLLSTALKQAKKRIKMAWLGKLMPLGIGAAIGLITNRKLAKKFISNARESLGVLPSRFDTAAPSKDEVNEPELESVEKALEN